MGGGKEHGERRRKRKGHENNNGQVKRHMKKRYSSSSSSSSSHNNSELFDRVRDKILVRILSLMPTKDCVKSSILAKRWRLLWTRVPNLKFHSADHKTLSSFIDFFNRFVFKHKGHSINTFSIAYYDWKDSEYKLETETLIATAIARNVQVIEIRSNFDLVLPQCLFTCKTLVELSLNSCSCICVEGPRVPIPIMTGTSSSVVYLPALKKLKLDGTLRYASEESVARLLSGCPALEELTIHKENDDVIRLHISSPTLTRLDLDMSDHNHYDSGAYRELKLDTPALEYLRLHDFLSRDFSAGMLASLTEADVDFDLNDALNPCSVLEFVGKLNNVSCLNLTTCWKWVEAPDSAFCALTSTEFRNLTKLELTGKDWRFLTTFLQNSDNLQVLYVTMNEDDDEDDEPQYWMEPKRVPVCLKYHLRTVRFEDFKCSEAEFNTVEYILRNAKVLKRMEILNSSKKIKSKARKRISLFERASEACEVVFNMEEVCL